MGNNIGGGNNKAAKIMKINGEYFKLKTPSMVIDIIKDYPNHILLDSEEFLRLNLRAKPLELEFELKPKRIYLLFELPKFPQTYNTRAKSPLRRVQSSVLESTTTTRKQIRALMTKRSISDLSMMTKSTDVGSFDNEGVGPTTRVKVRLPKAKVKKIMEESNYDDNEVAQRILRLSANEDGGNAVVEVVETGGGGGDNKENVVVEEEVDNDSVDHKRCFNVHGMCGRTYKQRKYKQLSF